MKDTKTWISENFLSRAKRSFSTQRPYYLLAMAVYLLLGLSSLPNFITADEHFWLPNQGADRILEYWEAVLDGDWKDTRINDKPGVTLAYLSGIALPFSGDLVERQVSETKGSPVKEYDPGAVRKINFLARFPLFLFIGLFSAYFFWILKKITGSERAAVWSVILMYLSPTLFGISQIVNPDTPFWVFGFASMLSFFAMLEFRERRFVWLSGLFFGLTLASKYVGIIFFPFFLLMIAIRFLFRADRFSGNREKLRREALADLVRYWAVSLGGVAIFAFLMPAAIVEPKVLFESTVGFQGMLPIFFGIIGFSLLSFADLILFRGRATFQAVRFLSRAVPYLGKILYTVLLASILFVFFNWISNNSLHDLSNIPFDAKTKDSFTEKNPFLDRYLTEYVPFVFSLTPVALVVLVLAWLQSLVSTMKRPLFVFTLSAFVPVFYLAVIKQGLLVTPRYSIILFPIAHVLGAIALDSLFREMPKTSRRRFVLASLGAIAILASATFAVVAFHGSAPLKTRLYMEHVIGYYFVPLTILVPLTMVGVVLLVVRLVELLPARFRIPSAAVSILLVLASIFPLLSIRPHYFVYVSPFLPDRYLLSTPWGYGGYEAAQYLNALPDAENITVWADMYGMCEFFVGKCIRTQRLDTDRYPVDYLYRTFGGAISPKFPHVSGDQVFRLEVAGRSGDYVKLIKNEHDSIMEQETD